MIQPYNDYLLLELDDNGGFVTAEDEASKIKGSGITSGLCVAAPARDTMYALTSYTWVLEDTSAKSLDTLCHHMQQLVGKVLYFEERADAGNTHEVDGKKYALIKLAKITGVGDA